jgi:hypothetical protein
MGIKNVTGISNSIIFKLNNVVYYPSKKITFSSGEELKKQLDFTGNETVIISDDLISDIFKEQYEIKSKSSGFIIYETDHNRLEAIHEKIIHVYHEIYKNSIANEKILTTCKAEDILKLLKLIDDGINEYLLLDKFNITYILHDQKSDIKVTIENITPRYFIRVFEPVSDNQLVDNFKECEEVSCVANKVIENLTTVVSAISGEINE